MASYRTRAKSLLGLTDTLQDEVLKTIEELTLMQFSALSGSEDVPDELDFIIVEVMVKRFNRLGSEGMASQSVEGLSMSFEQSDFEEYLPLIKRSFSKVYQAGFKVL